jgi:hypothetical protein
MAIRRGTGRRGVAVALLVVAAVAAGVSVFAQRGGFRTQRSMSSSGNVPYDGRFVFVRMAYPWMSRREAPWAHDYPFGEHNFMKIFTSISNVSAHVDESSIMTFGDPEMFKFPVIYLVEPGYWYLEENEVKALRDYLLKGGFLIVDDFPSQAWGQFDVNMSRVFPKLQWIQLDVTHPIFHTFFEINSFDIIPQAYNLGGRPQFWALFEDNDITKRMLVVANYQNDLSEFWEASDQGYYLVSESNEAYKIGVNQFIYGITR